VHADVCSCFSLLPLSSDEQRLRKKIEQLQSYRLNGIRTLADGELFELERRKRETGKSVASAKVAAAAGWEAPGSGAGKGPSGQAVPANPEWDVSKMPGHELLSPQERLLCSTLQLLPQHYLMIKERLIRECFTRGFLKENSAKQLIKIDVNKTSKIFDFFVSVGWLNTGDVIKTTQAGAATANNPAAAAVSAANKKPSASATAPAAPSASSSAAPRTGGNYAAASSGAVKMQQ
jgi:hypothetical protein